MFIICVSAAIWNLARFAVIPMGVDSDLLDFNWAKPHLKDEYRDQSPNP